MTKIWTSHSDVAIKLQWGVLLFSGLVLQFFLRTGANVTQEADFAGTWREEEEIHAGMKFAVQKSIGAFSPHDHSQLHYDSFDPVRAAMTRDRIKKQAMYTKISREPGRPGARSRRESLELVSVPVGMTDFSLTAYLAKVKIGTPPREFLGVADTGSEIVWVACDPCINCIPPPIFETNTSTSFENVPCSSTTCTSWWQSVRHNLSCPESGICPFSVGYLVGGTSGDLSSDVLTLTSQSGQSENFTNFVFGCSHATSADARYPTFGLNRGNLSLVSQLAPKVGGSTLAFCFGSYYKGNVTELTIGSKGEPNLTYTGLLPSGNDNLYRVNFTGISVGGTLLPLPADALTIHPNKTGPGALILDTGTSFALLLPDIHTAVLSAVDAKVTYPPGNGSFYDFYLCWDVTNVTFSTYDQLKLPNITFHFTNLNIPLPKKNTYIRLPPDNTTTVTVCLAVWLSPSEHEINIFGNYQMQNYYFFMDPENHRVGFKSGC